MALCSLRVKGRYIIVSLCLKIYVCTPSGMCGVWINVVVVTTGSINGGGAHNSSSYSYFAVVLIRHFILVFMRVAKGKMNISSSRG